MLPGANCPSAISFFASATVNRSNGLSPGFRSPQDKTGLRPFAVRYHDLAAIFDKIGNMSGSLSGRLILILDGSAPLIPDQGIAAYGYDT